MLLFPLTEKEIFLNALAFFILDALASFDFKLSLTESVSDSPFSNFQIINDIKS